MGPQGLDVLRDMELFSDLSPEELSRVSSLTMERRCQRGDTVFLQGQERERVFFIRSGLVKIYKVDEEGREHIMNILGRGQMFPHVGFFDTSPYPATAEVLAPSILYAIRCRAFDELLVEYPDIARKVMRVMGRKILDLQAKLQELALFDARERVIALLRHFSEEHGEPAADGIHIRLPVTHGEMARMIGITRESVNRIWNDLRRQGVLHGDRDDWTVNWSRLHRSTP
ncbi:Crp/Fnr family transcriptional regulator [Alicyclobacillus shizuokensis]|uniref:Crp/Fnr family transcriptional regulator n=1 Tax=Alicyclobacillus shizuokensis TaxID=392014 RepID=UPI000AF62508|nr:Crp/Fnr family transcriptional regulator [Alicyclobacillus shizuokensis]